MKGHRREGPVSTDDKEIQGQSGSGSESSDNEQQVKEFKEGGYGWYVWIKAPQLFVFCCWAGTVLS